MKAWIHNCLFFIVCCSNMAVGQEYRCSGGPGTLFQWSYGTSFSGGPDLDEPLVSDRPDFTESSVTVGRGVTQIEMGYTYTFDEEGADSTKSHSYPEVLLRHGILAEWLELRIFWNYGNASGFAGGGPFSVSGAEDLGLGLKIALTVLDYGRTTFGASCTGAAKFCVHQATEHANRHIFGQ